MAGPSWVHLAAVLRPPPPVFDLNPRWACWKPSMCGAHCMCHPTLNRAAHSQGCLANLPVLQDLDYKTGGQVCSWVINWVKKGMDSKVPP